MMGKIKTLHYNGVKVEIEIKPTKITYRIFPERYIEVDGCARWVFKIEGEKKTILAVIDNGFEKIKKAEFSSDLKIYGL